MNFLQVPEDLTCSISTTGRFDETYFQPMQGAKASNRSGYRWGVSPSNYAFPAGTTYSKHYLYQLGTAGSPLLPNIVTNTTADTIADAYLHPAKVLVSGATARFDRREGCYRLPQTRWTTNTPLSVSIQVAAAPLRNPVLCIPVPSDGTAVNVRSRVTLDGVDLPAQELSVGAAAPFLWRGGVVQVFRTLGVGRHTLELSAITPVLA